MKTPVVDWDLNPTEAEALQSRLCSKVIQEDCLGHVQRIAGIDVAYCQKSQAVYAGVVVLDSSNLNVMTTTPKDEPKQHLKKPIQ